MSLVLKWVLIALVVGWGIWSWRRMQRPRPSAPPKPPGAATQQLTAACAHCGVHAARAEMVVGQRGVYCCIQHAQAQGDDVAR